MVLPKILVLIRNPIFDRRPRPVRSSASRSAVVLFSMRETRRALCRAFCKMPHVHCFVCKRNTKEAVALSPCRLPSLSSSASLSVPRALLNATAQSRVTLYRLRQERLRAACGPRLEESGPEIRPKARQLVLGSWVGVRRLFTFPYSSPRTAWFYPRS